MKENNFDLLRLIAALQVVLIHSVEHLKIAHSISLDWILRILSYIPGVPIFFLISGYLIAMSYENNSDLRVYIKNRILRIYPALYVNLIFSIGILYVFGFIEINFHFFSWLLAQMTFFQFYNIEMFRGFGIGTINGSLWTISVELTFYIFLPIILFYYKQNKKIIIFLFLSSFLVALYDMDSNRLILINKLLHVSIIPYLFIFIIGISFYKFKEKIFFYVKNKFFLWLVFYIFFITLTSYMEWNNGILYLVLRWSIFSFLIFSFAFSFRNISQIFLKGNDYTYGIYIYHMLVINIFVELNLVSEINYLLVAYILSVFSGILSWHFLEKPILKLKKDSLFRINTKIKG